MNTLETSSGVSNVLGMLRKSCRFNGSCKVMLICIYSPNNKSRLRAASCGVSCVSHLPLLVTHSTDRFICIRNIFYFYCLVYILAGVVSNSFIFRHANLAFSFCWSSYFTCLTKLVSFWSKWHHVKFLSLLTYLYKYNIMSSMNYKSAIVYYLF